MQEDYDRDELASERTLLAAQRTYSAWIRTGLAGVGGGIAISRMITQDNNGVTYVAHIIAALLVIWGASVFIYAIIDYRRTCAKLRQKGPSKNAIRTLFLMTAVLLFISVLVLWITLL